MFARLTIPHIKPTKFNNLIPKLNRQLSSSTTLTKDLEDKLRQKYNIKDTSLDRYLKERIILVDTDDQQIGEMSLLESHLNENSIDKNMIHRAFSVFLFNENNQLLLQQRSKYKMAFPLLWANSCCSHPIINYNED